ncbi:tRNA (adenosine(37)-N6)-threonylcarbamoyltransferase complex ATPase subunit type 1 TsaE [Acidovorax sp. NCPPB 4044]|uniref:tRNA (adenosine(37)-N6)-threonylcarbamoyltransferase complex ATPase subunit type 1 TsaE n=1 Tax=Acidovorax sp. NCPPB 4044 TaxID=2940490 RepID=UPI0023029FAA|nr:tRNA (adenosine(37)-N6)-threonylcarbamoyltransferase complex ATPase subunit type 1 TsaE [Acidovorax sp. NCPPB 4044]MDA8519822.1 tRNA (adenosine(37)-N6)-threonylcarbamoyltransferase complex ATPase subunit type 1 TsaE [Acidovorax sp. NCPPB 4044]
MTAARHHPGIVESPPPPDGLALVWRSEDDTAAFARQLAGQPALADAFITLHGDLGAGKTTFVRHLLRALGVQGRIKSPTYAVVEPHEAAGRAAWHFDFYRFSDPREWEDAGFRDIFAGPGLKIAEWPEKAAGLIPPADLAIHIEASGDASGAYDGGDAARQVLLRAGTPLGRTLVQGLTTA